MAEGGNKKVKRGAKAAPPPDVAALPLDLPPAMFTPTGLLALADLLPVMTAFIDKEQRYRFLNKALAEWLELPRSEVLGRTMAEVIGETAYAARRPMVEAALAGTREFFASLFDHPTRGPLAVQTDYVPWVDPASGA